MGSFFREISTMRRFSILGLLGCLAIASLTGSVAAQSPHVVLAPVACIPPDGNTPVVVAVHPEPAVGEARVFFRREGFGDFYYLPLDRAAEGAYWSVLPIPEEGNHAGELFAAVVDAMGAVIAQSGLQVAPVRQDCVVELDAQQHARAQELTVGETVAPQKGQTVAWWRCEGIVQRVDHQGELRDDEVCAPAALWWQRSGLMAPLLGAGAVTVMMLDDTPAREICPARP
jgi:hypothetical protein